MMGRIARCLSVVGLFAAASAGIGGCAHAGGGQIYTSTQWRERGGALGKVSLIVAGPAHDGMQDQHAPRVTADVADALKKLPGTTVLEEKAPPKWADDVGDNAAIAEAKTQGAQSVCVMTVGQYSGWFWIGFPQGFGCESRVAYSLRLLDVQSGDLLAHSVRYDHVGGWLEICNPMDMESGLKKMLKKDLAAPAPPKVK